MTEQSIYAEDDVKVKHFFVGFALESCYKEVSEFKVPLYSHNLEMS